MFGDATRQGRSVSYPAGEGGPGGHALAEVPHDPDHNDSRLHVIDLRLRTQACVGSVRGASPSRDVTQRYGLRGGAFGG